MTSCSDTMLNYRLFQKFKLLGNGEFNHLTISLTRFYTVNGTSGWDVVGTYYYYTRHTYTHRTCTNACHRRSIVVIQIKYATSNLWLSHDVHFFPMFVWGSTHSMIPYVDKLLFPSPFHLFIGFYNSNPY